MATVNLPKGMGLDTEALEAGRWFELRTAPGVRVRLRPRNTREFRTTRSRIMGDMGLVGKAAEDPPPAELPDLIDMADARLYAETVLTDWDGPFRSDDGTELAYTPERGEAFLRDPRYRRIRDEILDLAAQEAAFMESREAELEVDVGNGSGGSYGTERP